LNLDSVNMNGTLPVFVSHYNNYALHAIAISLSVADNAVMQFIGQLPGTNIGTGSRIETINHPLPRTLSSKTNDDASTAMQLGNYSSQT